MKQTERPAGLVTRARIAVTCLLHDEGGLWSPSCVQSAVMPRDMNPALAWALVRAVLAELTRDGHAEAVPTRPGLEPLFRWTE